MRLSGSGAPSLGSNVVAEMEAASPAPAPLAGGVAGEGTAQPVRINSMHRTAQGNGAGRVKRFPTTRLSPLLARFSSIHIIEISPILILLLLGVSTIAEPV